MSPRDQRYHGDERSSIARRFSESTDSRIHGLIHRIEAFAQVSRVGFVLVVQQLSFT